MKKNILRISIAIGLLTLGSCASKQTYEYDWDGKLIKSVSRGG